jgi:DNA-binding NarL/FixJ family response regulator
MKTCLIVEDHAECQDWLSQITTTAFPDCRVTVRPDLKSAHAASGAGGFDLALIDLALPDGSGIELLRNLKSAAPQTLCVIVTVIGEDNQIVAALSAGADGYLLKEYPPELLSRQLRELSAGIPALSPSIARRIMEHFQRTGPMETTDQALTVRERQILALIARGYRNQEVAQQLGIAATTVASHIKAVYRKLGINTRAEASWYATRLGL